jgi:hypothetical protein
MALGITILKLIVSDFWAIEWGGNLVGHWSLVIGHLDC